MSIPRWIHKRLPNLVPIGPAVWQLSQTWICDPPNPPPRNAAWGVGQIVFSICPFPDEAADVYQIWCQSVHPFDSFPRLFNVWHLKKTKHPPPLVSRGAYPFPDESAHVYQNWCQSVQPFDSFPRVLNLWPHNPPPPNAPGVLNRSSPLTACPYFWICDPLNPPPPQCPLWHWWRLDFSLCPFPDESADVNQSWCQFDRLLNLWPPNPPPNAPGVLRGELYLAYVHSQTNLQTCTKFGVNRSSR